MRTRCLLSLFGDREREDTGGLEMISAELVSRGALITRQVSFEGVECSMLEAPLSDEWNTTHTAACAVGAAARLFPWP